MASACVSSLKTESYVNQEKTHWPAEGRHILAQFDEDTVVVYQAYKPSIAEYAVENQRFGGDFSFERMSWIKPNFLWMMYRSGWASKRNQERVLAIWLTRAAFDEILANAYTVQFQRSCGVQTSEIEVRLQWDPDHTPTYEKVSRRAIQLGLKGKILQKYGTEWIVRIEDITEFVKQQHSVLQSGGVGDLLVASERVYPAPSDAVASRIGLDALSEL